MRRHVPAGQPGVGAALLLGCWLIFGPLLVTSAQARRPVAEPQPAPALQLRQRAESALVGKNLALAAHLLAESYRLQPAPETLHLLARLAFAEGRILDAHDLLQRYLADPDLETSDLALPADSQQLRAQTPPPYARLSILGDRGTLVAVDGRLIGVLPLSLPILLSPAEHKLGFERGSTRDEDTVQIAAGHVGEFRYSRSPRAMLLTQLPTLLLVDDYGLLPAVAKQTLRQLVDTTVLHERTAVITQALGGELGADPRLVGCAFAVECNLKLARKLDADSVLNLRLLPVGKAGACQLALELADSAVGDFAARREQTLPACTVEAVSQLLSRELPALLQDGQRRGRAMLEVTSTPPGAELRLGSRLLGKTPFRGPIFAGELELELQLAGSAPLRRSQSVAAGETARVELELLPEPVEPPPASLILPPPSPPARRWPLLLGAGLSGVGAVIGGFGISGLVVDGQCASMSGASCSGVYDTKRPGAILLGIGVPLTLAGVVVLGVTLGRPASRAAKSASSESGTGAFR